MTEILNLKTSTAAMLTARMLRSATELGASDIHLEQGNRDTVLRFRRNGVLFGDAKLEKGVREHYQGIISRLKVMAGLDIAMRRLPQDGRIHWQNADNRVDIRLSLVPALEGERAVLRLIYGSDRPIEMSSLGLEGEDLRLFRRTLERSEGLIVVTGPTGSGKSTTLYSAMQFVNSPQRCVLSVEDPVERVIPGVGQVQVQSGIGLGFSTVLRAFLRQDPEVLVVGEMRDRETAEIAVRASLTGHLVLSTLHAGNCIASIARLRDMGLDAWLLGASLRLVIAQRLIRRLCPQCKTEDAAGTAFARAKGWLQEGECACVSAGCERCVQTGHAGRIGLFECLAVGEPLAETIVAGASDAKMRRAAGSFATLKDKATLLLARGEVDLTEFRRLAD